MERLMDLKCPICGSSDSLIILGDQVTCHSCRYVGNLQEFQILPAFIPRAAESALRDWQTSSVSYVVAGTVPPEPVIQTEIVSRRVSQELFPHTHEEFKQLHHEINELNKKLARARVKWDEIEKEIEELKGVYPKVVVVEEISKDKAKARIEDYFKEHITADIEELMLNLQIPVRTIVEVIDELRQEGKIASEGE